jgi:hypothetical protein
VLKTGRRCATLSVYLTGASMDIQQGIVAVLDTHDQVVGTGFLVAAGVVVTCAHVVQQAKSAPGKEITVRFAANQTSYAAQVDEKAFSPTAELDVAILRLEHYPKDARILPLGHSAGSERHDFATFGYPQLGEFVGLNASGRLEGKTITESGEHFLQINSQNVAPGMSGGPLLDLTRKFVIGMVNCGFLLEGSAKHRDTAFATPTESLWQVCPELQASEFCPYKNLQAFTEQDRDYFFGRAAVVENLLKKLRSNPGLLAVIGASGSGKSSLVQAGLLPRLRQGAIPGSETWGFLIARPGSAPLEALTRAGLPAKADLSEAIATWLTQNPGYTRLVLVLDQFEEIFTTCPPALRKDIDAQLATLFEKIPNFALVLTMRDEFLPRLNREMVGLLPWFNPGLTNIGMDISDEELREIITGPARQTGLEFEAGLEQVILEDVKKATLGAEGGRATMLPLLEFLLTKLWEKRMENKFLTHSAYRALGGVTGSIPDWANGVYRSLPAPQQALAQHLLLELVQLGEESPRVPDTRRRIPLEQVFRSENEREALLAVVKIFADEHLIITEREVDNPRTGQERIEIELIHEALIKEWAPFAGWINANREKKRWYRGFQARCQRWQQTNHDPGLLLGGLDLQEAQKWRTDPALALSPGEEQFIQASQQASQKIRRQGQALGLIQRIATTLTLLIVLGIILIDKTWYRFWPIPSAPPAVSLIALKVSGLDMLPSEASARLQPVIAQANSPTAADTLTIDLVPAKAGTLLLSLTLPEKPAYNLDFLPEIRSFGPEQVSAEEAENLIRAAAAYSTGKYQETVKRLKQSKSLSAKTLLAQANLFLDNFDASRTAYDEAIALAEARGEETSQLHMGAALAWWRPVLSDTVIERLSFEEFFTSKAKIKFNRCGKAYTYYKNISADIESHPRWYGIMRSFIAYCNRYGWKDAWAEKLKNMVIPHNGYISMADAISISWNETDNYPAISRNLNDAARVTLIAYKEQFLFSQYKSCNDAISARQKYQKLSFSKIDIGNVRGLLRQSCLTK